VSIEVRSPAAGELERALRTIYGAFGEELPANELERQGAIMPLDRILVASDGDSPVGTAASYPFELTAPGGSAVAAAGVTWCGVLPSHRRRGVLSELMRNQLTDLHRRGEPLAILWASEAPIYGRFGYGIAASELAINAERDAFALRDDQGRRGTVRLVTADEALELVPPLYESVRLSRPGYVSRSRAWWQHGVLADPEHWRDGAGPKFFALLAFDREAVAYAAYRLKSNWAEGAPRGELRVADVVATTPEATREIWRFLFGVDLVERVRCARLDPAWSPFLVVDDPRRLHVSVHDGLWLRFVDLEAALRARVYPEGAETVLHVEDALFEHNAGTWRVGPEVGRTSGEADVAISVADLAAPYLGAFTFEQLALAGRVRELRPGGVGRASTAFVTPLPPFCPEGF
jgi:predicted acetyltransferase